MRAQEIREFTDEELMEELERTREELARLRYRSAGEELENPTLMRNLRRDVARLRTVQRERVGRKEKVGG